MPLLIRSLHISWEKPFREHSAYGFVWWADVRIMYSIYYLTLHTVATVQKAIVREIWMAGLGNNLLIWYANPTLSKS